MEPVRVLWRLPQEGRVKINVHNFHIKEPLANENYSYIGVVIRNHFCRIVRMVAGSLGIRDRHLNELYSFLEGMKSAYLDKHPEYDLEADHVDAYWEWRDAEYLGVIHDHRYVDQQLTQRHDDENYDVHIRTISRAANELTTYLPRFEAEHFDRMVNLGCPFSRVYEIWCADMGLGPVGKSFMAINEADLQSEVEEGGEPEVMEEQGENNPQHGSVIGYTGRR